MIKIFHKTVSHALILSTNCVAVQSQKQHTVIKCLVKYPDFVYNPDGLEQLCDGLQEQLWQVQCYWLWNAIVASQGGCLLFIPTTFLITILYQQVMVRGRQLATTLFLEQVRYYAIQPCEFMLKSLLLLHLCTIWLTRCTNLCWSALCSGLKWESRFDIQVLIIS